MRTGVQGAYHINVPAGQGVCAQSELVALPTLGLELGAIGNAPGDAQQGAGALRQGTEASASTDSKSTQLNKQTRPTPTCFTSSTHVEATEICELVGARLCTVNELLADVARGTGCGYDEALHVWTKDKGACLDDTYLLAAGSTKAGRVAHASTTCSPPAPESASPMSSPFSDAVEFPVRCCADDHRKPPAAVGASTLPHAEFTEIGPGPCR